LTDTCELDIVSNAPIVIPKIPVIRLHKGLKPISPQLLQLYQDADIFVMPTHEDVYGMVYIEAMAAGLPCVGTTGMAIPELVQNNRTGLAIPPRDRSALLSALQTLITNPELRLTMGLTGRALVQKKFNAITHCQKLLSVFEQCKEQFSQPL
jgi:alpha-maltose-1-phosphate synthase